MTTFFYFSGNPAEMRKYHYMTGFYISFSLYPFGVNKPKQSVAGNLSSSAHLCAWYSLAPGKSNFGDCCGRGVFPSWILFAAGSEMDWGQVFFSFFFFFSCCSSLARALSFVGSCLTQSCGLHLQGTLWPLINMASTAWSVVPNMAVVDLECVQTTQGTGIQKGQVVCALSW